MNVQLIKITQTAVTQKICKQFLLSTIGTCRIVCGHIAVTRTMAVCYAANEETPTFGDKEIILAARAMRLLGPE